jgi:hypothetical protein
LSLRSNSGLKLANAFGVFNYQRAPGLILVCLQQFLEGGQMREGF